jgi:hypothetical protein
MNRVFLISPANCNGERARWVLRRNARSDLARRLRGAEGAPLGEVFTFLSALYFRGKLAYAQAFTRPPASASGVWIITPTAGLLPHDTVIRLSRLRGFSRVPITLKNRLYRYSLLRSVRRLSLEIGPDCEVVLLGSIATGKYLDLLTQGFGNRLRVPADFIGLGDMSRGALLLRCVRENRELDYLSVGSLAAEHVKRPKQVRQVSARVARADFLNTANGEPSGFRRESRQD